MPKSTTKKKKKKAPKSLSVYLVAAIRKVWYWSGKRRAVKRAATSCALCHKVTDELDIDHIERVGSVPPMWKGWDRYLTRMFDGELQALCRECHKAKTKAERETSRLCVRSGKK